MKKPCLSVILPTLNEGETLRRLITQLKNQSLQDVEIIVVYSGSNDDYEIARKLGVRVIKETGPHCSPSNARNIGAKAANSDIIVFLDVDFEVENNFLKNGLKIFDSNTVGVIPFVKFSRTTRLERILFAKLSDGDKFGLPFFWRKSVFLAMGGGDANLGFGDDRDMLTKLKNYIQSNGGEIKYSIDSIVVAHAPTTFQELFKQQRWYGRSIIPFFKKYPTLKSLFLFFRVGFLFLYLTLIYAWLNLPFWQVAFVISLPILLFEIYRLITSIRKDVFGLFIPVVDFFTSIAFVVGLTEYLLHKRKVSRD